MLVMYRFGRKKLGIKCVLLAVILIVTTDVLAKDKEIMVDVNQQQALNLTVYSNNLALIEDIRQIELPKGENTLVFKSVSAQLQPETAILKGNGFSLLEQSFEYDLLSSVSLARAFIGKTVEFKQPQPNTESAFDIQVGTLLAIDNQRAIIQSNQSVYTDIPLSSIIYPSIPNHLRDKPTLIIRLDNPKKNRQSLALSYLTSGMNWKTNYVLYLGAENKLSLDAKVSLTNSSGMNYEKAKLKLVAGEINQKSSNHLGLPRKAAMLGKSSNHSASAPFKSSGLSEYHLYTMNRPVDIANQQTKQIALFTKPLVSYKKQLVVDAQNQSLAYGGGTDKSYQPLAVMSQIKLENKTSEGLGLALPSGRVRVYQEDNKGQSQFIGADDIAHTPNNGSLTLSLGKSFDVTAKRKQTAYQKISNKRHKTTYEVIFKNAKNTPQTLIYRDHFYGDWKIVKTSLDSEKINSLKNQWKVIVPSQKTTKLTYTVIHK